MSNSSVSVSSQDSQELEWQLDAADLSAVGHWLEEHSAVDGLRIEPRPVQQLQDTYFDTADWRIYRAGFALRMRAKGDQGELTLKALKSSRDDAADRRELTEQIEHPRTDLRLEELVLSSNGPVGSRVRAVTGEEQLQPLFEVRTLRRRFGARLAEQTDDLGEIALDDTSISRPGGEARASLQRVEVEALTDVHAPVEQLVKTLRSECSLDPGGESKFELGLKSMGLTPQLAPQLAPSSVDSSMTAGEVAFANLRRLLSNWFSHEPGARLGDDPEELHLLRVTARRMQAILNLYAPYLPATLARSRSALRNVLQVLGDARDLDVQLGDLAAFSSTLTASERATLEPFQRYLETERTRVRTRMLRSLDSAVTRQWFEKLARILAQPSSVPTPRRETLATSAVAALIRRRFRKLRKRFERLDETSSMEAYHAVRGRAKKLRYAIESASVIYGKPAEGMLRALRRLQDRLGRQQDAYVAGNRLLSLANDPQPGLPSGTLFLMGRLAEWHSGSARDARQRAKKVWRKVRGRRWKALRRKLRQLSPTRSEHAPRTVRSTHSDSPADSEVLTDGSEAAQAPSPGETENAKTSDESRAS